MAPSARCVSIDTVRSAGPAKASAEAANTPVRVVFVARLGGGFEREARAVQADQAIGQLVLDRLELADELAELLSDLGVVHGQLERALRRAERPAGAGEPCHQRDVGERLRR